MLFWIAVMWCAAAGAGLQWDPEHAVVESPPNAGQVHVEFRCTNSGAVPVTIRNVRPSCGCVTTAMAGTVIGPGEAGVLAADMTVSGLSGTLSKKIWITTDDPDAPVSVLTLEVRIPVYFRTGPTFLSWQRGEPATTQSVEIEILHQDPIRVAGVAAGSGQFGVSLQTLEPGRRYRVDVVPLVPDEVCRDEVAVTLDFPTDRPFTIPIMMVVRNTHRQPETMERRIVSWLASRADALCWVTVAVAAAAATLVFWRLNRRWQQRASPTVDTASSSVSGDDAGNP